MPDIETKLAERPAERPATVNVTYIPRENGDPHVTHISGVKTGNEPIGTPGKRITFRAHVSVPVPADAFIYAPICRAKETPDGVRTQAIESKVSLIESLANNPAFLVEGREQAERKRGRPRLPSNPDEYRGHALRWIAGAEAGPAMKERWIAEEKLREECGCTEGDLAQVMPFYWARLEVLGEAA